jgi:hypothetical protein
MANLFSAVAAPIMMTRLWFISGLSGLHSMLQAPICYAVALECVGNIGAFALSRTGDSTKDAPGDAKGDMVPVTADCGIGFAIYLGIGAMLYALFVGLHFDWSSAWIYGTSGPRGC